jgi:site-specific DNA recombinase
MTAQLPKIEKQIDQLLDRIVDVNVPSVIAALEKRIAKLEREKIVLQERIAEAPLPKTSFDKTLRTTLEFLSNPWILWRSKALEDRRTVLKLAFAKPLRYQREKGFRTANLTLPFKMLAEISGDKVGMARRKGFEHTRRSNRLVPGYAIKNVGFRQVATASRMAGIGRKAAIRVARG